MTLLLHTCVLSEHVCARPDAHVIDWLDAQPEAGLFISAISLAEIEKGIFKLRLKPDATTAPHTRANTLSLWFAHLTERFATRTLSVDAAVWRVWALQSAGAGATLKRWRRWTAC